MPRLKSFLSVTTIGFFVIFIVLFLFKTTAFSANTTWYVDNNYPDDPDISQPLGSKKNPFSGIKIAVGDSRVKSGDKIIVASNRVYVESNVGFEKKSLEIISEDGPSTTEIRGDNSNSTVWIHEGEFNSSVLSGFTITNGNATRGGGIHINNASPSIINCIIRNNSGGSGLSGGGGGVYIANGNPLFESCYIINNSCSYDEDGGGVLVEAAGYPRFTNCVFAGNTVTGSFGRGSAIRATADAALNLLNCTIANNNATSGSFTVSLDNPKMTSILTNCLFYDNTENSGNIDLRSNTINLGTHDPVLRNCFLDHKRDYEYDSAHSSDNIRDSSLSPDFFNTSSFDYRLDMTSDCISTGANGDSYDQRGVSRPYYITSRWDIGAYEFNFSSLIHQNRHGGDESSTWSPGVVDWKEIQPDTFDREVDTSVSQGSTIQTHKVHFYKITLPAGENFGTLRLYANSSIQASPSETYGYLVKTVTESDEDYGNNYYVTESILFENDNADDSTGNFSINYPYVDGRATYYYLAVKGQNLNPYNLHAWLQLDNEGNMCSNPVTDDNDPIANTAYTFDRTIFDSGYQEKTIPKNGITSTIDFEDDIDVHKIEFSVPGTLEIEWDEKTISVIVKDADCTEITHGIFNNETSIIIDNNTHDSFFVEIRKHDQHTFSGPIAYKLSLNYYPPDDRTDTVTGSFPADWEGKTFDTTGSHSYDKSTDIYTVSGNGIGINTNSKDEFYYLFKEVAGDFDFYVRVLNLETTEISSYQEFAGVMARNSFSSGSRNLISGVTPCSCSSGSTCEDTVPGSICKFSFRNRTTDSVNGIANVEVQGIDDGSFMRIRREGNTYYSYYGDGTNWTGGTGSYVVTMEGIGELMGTKTMVGMAVSSHNTTPDYIHLVSSPEYPVPPYMEEFYYKCRTYHVADDTNKPREINVNIYGNTYRCIKDHEASLENRPLYVNLPDDGYQHTSYEAIKTHDSPQKPLPVYINNGGNSYECIQSHTSGATTEPGAGTDFSFYWKSIATNSNYDTWTSGREYGPARQYYWQTVDYDTDYPAWDTGELNYGKSYQYWRRDVYNAQYSGWTQGRLYGPGWLGYWQQQSLLPENITSIQWTAGSIYETSQASPAEFTDVVLDTSDVVLQPTNYINRNTETYVCLLTHVSDTADNGPESGANWSTYWEKLPVYSSGHPEWGAGQTYQGTYSGSESGHITIRPASLKTDVDIFEFRVPSMGTLSVETTGLPDETAYVNHNNQSYACITDSTNIEPGISENWHYYWLKQQDLNPSYPPWNALTTYNSAPKSKLRIYNAIGEKISDNGSSVIGSGNYGISQALVSDPENSSNQIAVAFTVPKGTYYAVVSHLDGYHAPFSYGVTIGFNDTSLTDDHGDYREQATFLEEWSTSPYTEPRLYYNREERCTIDVKTEPDTDKDYFRFSVPPYADYPYGGWVRIMADNANTSDGINARLLDYKGNLIEASPDIRVDQPEHPVNEGGMIETRLDTGTYYIEITGAESTQYELVVDFDDFGDSWNHNPKPYTGYNTIKGHLETIRNPSIAGSYDSDVFLINVPFANMPFVIYTTGGSDTYGELLNSDGSGIKSSGVNTPPSWSLGTMYYQDDVITYNSGYYRCLSDTDSVQPGNNANWAVVDPDNLPYPYNPSPTDGGNFLITHTFRTPGEYYILLRMDDGVDLAGDYRLFMHISDDHPDNWNYPEPPITEINSGAAPNASVTGTLERAGDRDFFRYIAASDGRLTITSTGGTDLSSSLYNDGCTFRLKQDSNGAGDIQGNIRIEYDVKEGLTYYFYVMAEHALDTGGYTLNFDLSTSVLPDDDGVSGTNGDDYYNARPVALSGSGNLSGSYTGVIDYGSDNDFFYFDLPRDGLLTIYTTGSLDTYGALFHFDGGMYHRMAVNDNAPFTDVFDTINPKLSNFGIRLYTDTGRYYVRVRTVSPYETGEYSLNIDFREYLEDDFGNTCIEAYPLSDSEYNNVSGINRFHLSGAQIDIEEDIDIFKIVAGPDELTGNRGRVNVYTDNASMDPYGYLKNAMCGTLVLNDNAIGHAQNFNINWTPDCEIVCTENCNPCKPETYYIGVRSFDMNETGSYDLIVQTNGRFVENDSPTTVYLGSEDGNCHYLGFDAPPNKRFFNAYATNTSGLTGVTAELVSGTGDVMASVSGDNFHLAYDTMASGLHYVKVCCTNTLQGSLTLQLKTTEYTDRNMGNGSGSFVVNEFYDVSSERVLTSLEITAEGSDVWDGSDNGYFTYRPIEGDLEMIATVTFDTGHGNIQQWSKAGLMIRDSLDAASKNIFSLVHYNDTLSQLQFRTQTRLADGSSTSNTDDTNVTNGYVRLHYYKQDNRVTTSYSSDGINWIQNTSQVVSMSGTVYAGFAVSSFVDDTSVRVRFDDIQIIDNPVN